MSTMELEGMANILSKIEEMGKQANRTVNSALKKASEPILEDAKSNAPVRTGKGKAGLKKGSIKTTKDGKKYIEIGITKGDISDIFYMKFHEFGEKLPN